MSKLTGKSLNITKKTHGVYPIHQTARTVIRLVWWRLNLSRYYF